MTEKKLFDGIIRLLHDYTNSHPDKDIEMLLKVISHFIGVLQISYPDNYIEILMKLCFINEETILKEEESLQEEEMVN